MIFPPTVGETGACVCFSCSGNALALLLVKRFLILSVPPSCPLKLTAKLCALREDLKQPVPVTEDSQFVHDICKHDEPALLLFS